MWEMDNQMSPLQPLLDLTLYAFPSLQIIKRLIQRFGFPYRRLGQVL